MKESPVIKLEDICFSYKSKNILKNISLEIKKGEFLGIIGPNGSGKTTLLRIMTGFLRPESGYVYFKEKNISEYYIKELAREIAVLPQTIDISYPYSVEEFISIARYPHTNQFFFSREKEKEFIESIMNTMEVTHLKERRITELSQGERQRIFIAQLLAQEPSVMMLDEPVNHFDIKYQLKTLELLEGLNRDGMTIIIVLHDLNLASEFCNRVILISNGSIYKGGTPHEVLTYKNIEDVYKTVVVVKVNPISGKPYIIPVSRRYLKQ